jgi:hypothetical protein
VAPGIAQSGNALIGLLVLKPAWAGGTTNAGALTVLIAAPAAATTNPVRRPPPLSFSMSGLAG